jgi:hypothetical protein
LRIRVTRPEAAAIHRKHQHHVFHGIAYIGI